MPGGPAVKTLLPLLRGGVQVQSLAGELRSRMSCNAAQKKVYSRTGWFLKCLANYRIGKGKFSNSFL